MISFKWRHFQKDIILLVVHYAPKLEEAFRQTHKREVGKSWRMDETYVKIKGVWHYLYRAVDKEGNTIDFKLTEKRDEPAARSFFEKAIGCHGLPEKVTLDKSGANKAAMDTLNVQLILLALLSYFMSGQLTQWPFQIQIRQIKYLNNIVEQDH